jgi:hypothetical protein
VFLMNMLPPNKARRVSEASKLQTSTRLHGITFQKIAPFMVSDVRTAVLRNIVHVVDICNQT